jgi:AraC-like DNA-binding protein
MAFARNTGMSPKAYVKRRLNQEALQLLLNSDLKIKDVASQLRFSDEFHFSRFFRIANGLAPLEYRRAFYGHSSSRAKMWGKHLSSGFLSHPSLL